MAVFGSIVHRPDDDDFWGKHQRQVFEVTGDDDYPTGGYPVNSQDFGGGNIRSVRVVGRNAAAAVIIAEWDYVNGKLLLIHPTGGGSAPATLTAPVATTPILAHDTADTTPVTASAADQPSHAATAGTLAAGIGLELADDTDVSTCKWLLEVISC